MNKPSWEGIKEIARWVLLFGASTVISWFITETLRQITAVPEFFQIKVWVFVYLIPVRTLFTLALTFLGKFIDKYLFVQSKENAVKTGEEPKGLVPF